MASYLYAVDLGIRYTVCSSHIQASPDQYEKNRTQSNLEFVLDSVYDIYGECLLDPYFTSVVTDEHGME
jgi:hypothetical protein